MAALASRNVMDGQLVVGPICFQGLTVRLAGGTVIPVKNFRVTPPQQPEFDTIDFEPVPQYVRSQRVEVKVEFPDDEPRRWLENLPPGMVLGDMPADVAADWLEERGDERGPLVRNAKSLGEVLFILKFGIESALLAMMVSDFFAETGCSIDAPFINTDLVNEARWFWRQAGKG
jgi:hypothetical protein